MKQIIYRLNLNNKLEYTERTIVYHKVKGKLKYELLEKLTFQTGIRLRKPIQIGRITLRTTGLLILDIRYRWDGSTGVPDSEADMRASAGHDALFGLLGYHGLLYRLLIKINDLYSKWCKEDGMPEWRYKLSRLGLRLFSRMHIKRMNNNTPVTATEVNIGVVG